MENPTSILTSAITFVETEHGRMRRRQRDITKKDLQSARKHGSKLHGWVGITNLKHPSSKHSFHRTEKWYPPWSNNRNHAAAYTYNGIVYVTNERTGEEITSYATPIHLDHVRITSEMQDSHVKATQIIADDKTKWNSNTVIVIDTSGSMRESDVFETRTRLDAVWLAVALDFVAHRIASGAAGNLDVVSIITLGDYSETLILQQPTTWVLYNHIVDFYTSKSVRPRGHGLYIPSLDKAETLLTANTNASCAMGLCFISDGQPSDSTMMKGISDQGLHIISEKVASLAKRFGRRLQFDAVGIGDEDFDTLEAMVDTAADYGAKASLKLPSKSAGVLGNVLESFATSVTSTQTEMTCVDTSNQQKVKEVKRESRIKANKEITSVSDEDFYIYDKQDVKRTVYSEWYKNKQRKFGFEEAPLQDPSAKFVAMAEAAFGEGGERLAYRFYEVDSDRSTIVGKPLVAKESRFIVDGDDNESARRKFVQTFCKTQQLAGRIAEEFNKKLDTLNRVDKTTPRASFLDCSVYLIDDQCTCRRET